MHSQAMSEKEANLLFYMQTLGGMEAELKYSANERLLFETATLSCINEINEILSLQKRVEALEKGKVQLPEKKLGEVRQAKAVVKPQMQTLVKKIEVEAINQTQDVNINKLWGKFLIELSAKDHPVLYTAAIDATPISFINNVFTIQTANKVVLNTLSREENKKTIEQFLKKFCV